MRKILLVAMLTAAVAAPASALLVIGGTVTAVDNTAKTITCHGRASVTGQIGDFTYKTTDKTIFRVGKKQGSFADLKVGETISVRFHPQGDDRILDRVTIITP